MDGFFLGCIDADRNDQRTNLKRSATPTKFFSEIKHLHIYPTNQDVSNSYDDSHYFSSRLYLFEETHFLFGFDCNRFDFIHSFMSFIHVQSGGPFIHIQSSGKLGTRIHSFSLSLSPCIFNEKSVFVPNMHHRQLNAGSLADKITPPHSELSQ